MFIGCLDLSNCCKIWTVRVCCLWGSYRSHKVELHLLSVPLHLSCNIVLHDTCSSAPTGLLHGHTCVLNFTRAMGGRKFHLSNHWKNEERKRRQKRAEGSTCLEDSSSPGMRPVQCPYQCQFTARAQCLTSPISPHDYSVVTVYRLHGLMLGRSRFYSASSLHMIRMHPYSSLSPSNTTSVRPSVWAAKF